MAKIEFATCALCNTKTTLDRIKDATEPICEACFEDLDLEVCNFPGCQKLGGYDVKFFGPMCPHHAVFFKKAKISFEDGHIVIRFRVEC